MEESLRQLLDQLRAEIDAAEQGQVDRAELGRLAAAVEAKVSPGEGGDDEGLIDELQESVLRYEASHPRLAEAIGRLADGLSAMGL
jgi:hypothetical protein